MRYLLLLLCYTLLFPVFLAGQSTHKLVYSFSPERVIFKGDTLYATRAFPRDLPGFQRIDSIAINYGTYDTLTQDGRLIFEVTYPCESVKNVLELNVELFYHLEQSDIYAKTIFSKEGQKEQDTWVFQACFEAVPPAEVKENAFLTFRQNLKQLIDTLPNLTSQQFESEKELENFRDKIVEAGLKLAIQEGLTATIVKGYVFPQGGMFQSSWLLVNDPVLGTVTVDPYSVWGDIYTNTVEDLTAFYIITESCFDDPLEGRWISQVHRKRRGVNPVRRLESGVNFLTLVQSDAVEYYNAGKLAEAEQLFGILSDLTPSSYTPRMFGAVINARQGEFDAATKSFEVLLGYDYISSVAKGGIYYAYGNCLALQDRKEESVRYIKKAFSERAQFISSRQVLEDEDLKNLRNYPPFISFIRQLELKETHSRR